MTKIFKGDNIFRKGGKNNIFGKIYSPDLVSGVSNESQILMIYFDKK